MIKRAVLLLCALALPHLAEAEGRHIVFDCLATSECDAVGDCELVDLGWRFDLSPVNVLADNSGEYSMTISGMPVQVHAGSDHSYSWVASGDTLHNFFFTDEAHAIMVVRNFSDDFYTSIQFLTCEGPL